VTKYTYFRRTAAPNELQFRCGLHSLKYAKSYYNRSKIVLFSWSRPCPSAKTLNQPPPLPFHRKVVKTSKPSASCFPKPWSERIGVIGFVFLIFFNFLIFYVDIKRAAPFRVETSYLTA
jgi:hypothetical protein